MIVEARSEHARGATAARRLRARACRYLSALGREDAQVSILVVGDAAIRRLNRRWRGKDQATDVLSFPQGVPSAGPLLGDLVISLDTARRVARADGRSAGAELDRYLAHGLLHLLGHDHARAEDAKRMAAAEDALVGEGMIAASGRRTPGRARRGGLLAASRRGGLLAAFWRGQKQEHETATAAPAQSKQGREIATALPGTPDRARRGQGRCRETATALPAQSKKSRSRSRSGDRPK